MPMSEYKHQIGIHKPPTKREEIATNNHKADFTSNLSDSALSIFIVFVPSDCHTGDNVLYLFAAAFREIVQNITYFLILPLYFCSLQNVQKLAVENNLILDKTLSLPPIIEFLIYFNSIVKWGFSRRTRKMIPQLIKISPAFIFRNVQHIFHSDFLCPTKVKKELVFLSREDTVYMDVQTFEDSAFSKPTHQQNNSKYIWLLFLQNQVY